MAGCGYQFDDSDPLGNSVILERNSDEAPCISQGYFKEPINWHGYLIKATLPPRNAMIYYHITYPEEKCCIKLLLYKHKQVLDLRAKTMSCLQRQAVLDPTGTQVNQVISDGNPFAAIILLSDLNYHCMRMALIQRHLVVGTQLSVYCNIRFYLQNMEKL